MSDEKEELKLPKEPQSSLSAATFYALCGVVMGGIIEAAVSKLTGLKGNKFIDRVGAQALNTGFITGLVGYFLGERDNVEYKMKIENIKLQQLQRQIDVLKEDKKSDDDKSFTKALIEEKIDDCKTKQRG